MPEKKTWFQELKTAYNVGFFLAIRDIKRANKWTTALIVSVMVLTFLNLVVVSGILVGLIEGSIEASKARYTGDIIISAFPERQFIENSQDIIKIAENIPHFDALTWRYTAGGKIESNYKDTLEQGEVINSASGLVAGIDPDREDSVTGISEKVIEGEYLDRSDTDSILVGKDLLYKYTPIESPGFQTLKDAEIGTRVRLTVNGVSREVTIKGIIKSKAGEVDARIYMIDSELRKMIGRTDQNVDEIAIFLDAEGDAIAAKDALVASGVGKYAKVQTSEEAQPKFLKDIKATFAILGNMFSFIGLVVASITIFIVIFVNAITRRRYIGILKGIGVSRRAIEFSYILQAIFYASMGIILGMILVFGVIQPGIAANPIDFPFSDGILATTVVGTVVRIIILMFATIIAGFIPARIVIKQRTLDAILGR